MKLIAIGVSKERALRFGQVVVLRGGVRGKRRSSQVVPGRCQKLNFVTCNKLSARTPKDRGLCVLILTIMLFTCLAGCSDEVRPSSAKQLAEFAQAGPVHPTAERDQLLSAEASRRAYRVMPGEVLELTMPAALEIATIEEPDGIREVSPYMCRVSEGGTITLPVVGELEVAGMTLAQVEAAVIDAYYPTYAATRPSVFARLVEQNEQPPFTVIGLVSRPGTFPYPANVQYNLMQAIGFAGGLNVDLEPRYAMLYRLKPNGQIASAVLDVADGSDRTDALATRIKPGDIVAVEHTPRTRTNAFLNRVFRINIGTYSYLRLDDLGND
jgi:protein involved in polysaccharide export with SLBB domain